MLSIYLQRWRFSVAFNPIKKWGYEDDQHLSNHMKKCPFNIKYCFLFNFVAFIKLLIFIYYNSRSNCFPSQPVALPVFIQNN